jgi:hypothetical protein
MLALIESPYAQVTDELYSVFHHTRAAVPGTRYGGAYAHKPGFHSSVEDNLERWPGNYSVREAINRQTPRTVARALDLTWSSTQMRKRTAYLAAAAAADDPRLRCVREFYGTLDGTTVFGRAHTGPDTDWYASSADTSHLWHLHLSFFTPYVDDWVALAGVVSVLVGEPLHDYDPEGALMYLVKYGDHDTDQREHVKYWQRLLVRVGEKLPKYGIDGGFGDEMAAAVKSWYRKHASSPGTFDGKRISSWIAMELQAQVYGNGAAAPAPTQAQVNSAVATYMAAHPVKVPTGVRLDLGTVNGTLTGG